MKLEIAKILSSRSERVKSLDIHPTEPHLLVALYSGSICVYNYLTSTIIRQIDVSDQPVRAAKFIARKGWICCGNDDMMLRVFDGVEKIAQFEAHMDYLRSIDVHPTQNFILTSSDDMTIKLWEWDNQNNFHLRQSFEGHTHYVMCAVFNPKNPNTFASASLDKTIKLWSIGSPLPNFTLDEVHTKGVNTIAFVTDGDKPYILSGADDKSIAVTDFQTKSVVALLEGHSSNVSAVVSHPRLPIILSASEDGTVRIWSSKTFKMLTTLNYGLERAWCLAVTASSNKVAIGFDEGTIVIALGQEKPVISMDGSGKVLMANNHEVVSFSLRGASASNGEAIDYQTKDLGSCELFPQTIQHNSNGRFVSILGDSEYIIYTSQALRNKAFGSGLDFAWSSEGTGDYAVRESSSRIHVFKNFKESQVFKPPFSAEGLFGGPLIAVPGADFVVFFDWECRLVMRIDAAVRDVFWSPDAEHVVLACEDSYFVLQCDFDGITDAFANGTAHPEDGVEGAFTLINEVAESVESGQWVGSCFLYTNTSRRLNYMVGTEVMPLAHLDRQLFLLGFVARENKVFMVDKDKVVSSFELLESVLQYESAVVRKDFELADQLLANIPREKYNEISRFLEAQGHKDVALQVADDPDQKFELALQLEKLDVALEIMQNHLVPSADSTQEDNETRWKQLGDLALGSGNLTLAEECCKNASDFSGLLLMYTSSGNLPGIRALLESAKAANRSNIAFICCLLLQDKLGCIKILQEAGRHAESAFFARTYIPSETQLCVENWKSDLEKVNRKAAEALADPKEYPDLFPDFDTALQVEAMVNAASRGKTCSSLAYPKVAGNLSGVLVDLVKENGPGAIAEVFANYQRSQNPAASSPTPEEPPAAPPSRDIEAEILAKEKKEAEEAARAQAEAQAEAEARAQAEAEAQAQAKAQAEAEARAQAEAQAKAQAEAEAQARAKAEAEAKAQAEAQARAQAEAEAKAQAEAQAKAEQERRVAELKAEQERLKTEQEEAAAAAAAASASSAAANADDALEAELQEELGMDDEMLEEEMDELGDDLDEDGFEDWS